MNGPHDRNRTVEETERSRLTLALAGTILLAVTLDGGWLRVRADEDARQAQVTRAVNDALNKATALREQSKSALRGGAALFAQAREQAQRALALVENGPADAALKARVRQLIAELDEEEKDRTLIAALDEARLAQAEMVAGENRFASERAVPLFRAAFRAYGLPAGEGKPAAAAERIRQRPAAVREAIIAALDEWDDLAGSPKLGIKEPHREWLRAVLEAAEPDDAWTRQVRVARRETDPARRTAALEVLARSADVAKSPARALTRLAGLLPPPEAARLLRRTQAHYPADFWTNHELGLALTRVTPPQWDEAVRFLTAAMVLRPDAPGAHLNLGAALLNKGQVDEAIASFRKAIELDPKCAQAFDGLGHALLTRGQIDEAIACWRSVITLDPKYVMAHNNLGLALSARGQIDEAIASYRKAIELDPSHTAVHANLGSALQAKGKLDEAIACYRRAIELDPRNAAAYDHLGLALAGKGQFDAASASYRKAIELDPRNARARTALARAQRLAAVQDKLPALLKADFKPTTNEERLALSELCKIKKLYRTSAGLCAGAFAADPKLADDLKAGHRYNAACFAALAAAGLGEDTGKLDDTEKARLRKQARDWLRADLALRTKQLESGEPADRIAVGQTMKHWQQDSDLAGIRDEGALLSLPAEECARWEKLWTDVAALRKKAEAPTQKEGK
jgi:tetratricopeptide (TPR) repeat protein